MRISHSLLVLLLLIGVSACKKDKLEFDDASELSAFIQDEQEAQDIPAVSVLAFRNDEIIYTENFGKAHLGQNIALQADHPFLIASISKVVTATALLQLEEQNLLDLDDPINSYLPFIVQPPNTSTPITFRMLLTHTASIGDGSALDDEYYYGTDSPTALGDFLASYLVPGGADYDAVDNFIDAEPGTVAEYSNVGSALIGYLVEVISGQDFNAYCKQHIFQPLGMDHTAWRLSEINGTIVQPYDYVGGANQEIQHYTFTDYPNGGLRTTTLDFFQLAKLFVLGGTSNGEQILSANTVNAMMTLQIPDLEAETGLHLFVMDAGRGIWGHDGGEMGVSTIAGWNPETGAGAIVFANQGDADLDDIFTAAYLFALGE